MGVPGIEDLPLGRDVTVLAEHPSGLIAFSKPAGVLSHPNRAKDAPRALLKAPYDRSDECYLVEAAGGTGRVWLLNRLDSATSGVLLCALDATVAEIVRQLFSRGEVSKRYYALVFGKMNPGQQTWRDRLKVSRQEGRLRTGAGGGAEAETIVSVKKIFPGRYPVSLLELQPKTGRTHQLRVQCARRKLPIVGDRTYGDFARNRQFAQAAGRKRLFLHSAEVRLAFSLGGIKQSFAARAPLPPEFSP